MGNVVKVNKLSAYLDRLKKARENQDPDKIANRIANEGKAIAETYYNADRDPDKPSKITVTAIPAENGKTKIVARGEGILYLEYGTGKLGEQSNYNFKNPVPRTFHSNKLDREVSLSDWTYNYAHKANNELPEIDGHKAFAQMFNTAQELRQKYAKYVRENPDV